MPKLDTPTFASSAIILFTFKYFIYMEIALTVGLNNLINLFIRLLDNALKYFDSSVLRFK